MNMNKSAALVIIGILAVGLFFFATRSTPTSQTQKSSNAEEKCKADSDAFAYKYKLDNGGPSITWNPTQSHFNTKLKTCLIYIGNVSEINSLSSLRMEKVFDLSTGKVILLSNTKKECSDPNSCTVNPVDSDVPGQLSYGSDYFSSKMAELMQD